jgi:hypothetical protein
MRNLFLSNFYWKFILTTKHRKTYRPTPPPESLYAIASKRHGPDYIDTAYQIFAALKEAVSYVSIDDPGRHPMLQAIWDWLYAECTKADDPAWEGLKPNNRPHNPMETLIAPDLKYTRATNHKPRR